MIGFHELRRPDELTRDDLPRVVRPFWAASQLRDAWADRFARQQLISAYERLGGICFGCYEEGAVLDTLEEAITAGRLLMLVVEPVTFDPVASRQGGAIVLHSKEAHEPLGFTRTLESVLQRRSVAAGRRTAAPESSETSRPLSFEESVAANKKFFGQPVSRVAPAPKTAPKPAPQTGTLVLHFEMDIHAPASRNDRFTLRTLDGVWSQQIDMRSMSYVQDHWLELVFDEVPRDGRFELIQHPSEPGRTPFFVFRHLSYAELSEPASEQVA